ncbi:MAG TPA: homoserine dehydrogenase [Myxococcales bacterium]|jgi:homoserine dehydrogenase
MKALRIGLLGCGTVGGGVVQLLHENASYLATRAGAPLEIAKVLVRDTDRARVQQLDRSLLTRNPEEVLGDPSIDVMVETMGGVDPTRSFVERALSRGQSVVTANKMLLALHGPALLELAAKHGADLAFEGSVGGGIPIVRTLREALASDWVVSLRGIVNGTCNYILSRMREDGESFEGALREAQAKGYAEAEPSLDVDGHDAAHKLVVLAMLAFGARVDSGSVPTEGIRRIEPVDHRFAARFGFAIKHLALGRDLGHAIELCVRPSLVRDDSVLANVGGVLNAIALEGRALGPCLLSGRGAGDLPTAVSVVADIVDVARARVQGTQGLDTRAIQLAARPLSPLAESRCRHYLRFPVRDVPGVLARIAGALGDCGVSIEQMVQEGQGHEASVQIVLLTHVAREQDVDAALARLHGADFAAAPALRLHVVE